jgi:hypothetical protein
MLKDSSGYRTACTIQYNTWLRDPHRAVLGQFTQEFNSRSLQNLSKNSLKLYKRLKLETM